MSGVVRMNMSESSYAIDSAWSLLQNDDKIEKIVPLIPLAVGAGFGLLGAYSGAGGRFINPKTGKFDPGIHADAALHDPLTGGILMDHELGSSGRSRLAGGAFGALQGLNPLAITGGIARGARSTVGLSRAQRAQRAANRAKAAREASTRTAADARGAVQNRMAARAERDELLGLREAGVPINFRDVNALNQRIASRAPEAQFELAAQAARRSNKLGRKASRLDEIAQQPTAYQQYGTAARIPQVIGQGIQQGVPELALAAVAPFVQGALPSAGGVDTSGYGSSTSSAGATGATNTPVLGNQDPTRRKKIWQGVEDSAQYGGKAVATGEEMHIANRLLKSDNMFTNRLGNEMISEIKYRIHKAHCGTEQKAECSACKKKDCLGKAHCMGERKAEGLEMVEHGGKKVPKFAADGKGAKDMKKKDDKKPAHGMVIVIGSKAGPGPSKNGKRQKLDSENKDD